MHHWSGSHLLDRSAGTPACRPFRSEGGWYAVVQVPSFGSEEELVLDLLNRDGVLAHPGYFFDFPRESYLIVSLLAPESTFATGFERLLARAIAPAVTSTAERSTARESAREIE